MLLCRLCLRLSLLLLIRRIHNKANQCRKKKDQLVIIFLVSTEVAKFPCISLRINT